MKRKKILIIEDIENDYLTLFKKLDAYELNIYPENKAKFKDFAQKLTTYAIQKDPISFDKIKETIESVQPDIVFLDICLRPHKESYDQTGIILYEKIIANLPIRPEVFTLSTTLEEYIPIEDTTHISKNSDIGLGYEIENKLEKRSLIQKKSQPSIPQTNIDEDTTQSSASSGKFPASYYTTNNIIHNKISPWFNSLLNYSITFFLLLTIVALFSAGVYFLLTKVINKYTEPVIIAEYSFISFLPTLIVFGFYVFYARSLRPYIVEDSKTEVDFENSSKLLNLTKKLFISSLISYLFVKIIEIFQEYLDEKTPVTTATVTEKETMVTLPRTTPTSITELIAQVSIPLVLIISLILFYMYLNKHTVHSEKKPKKA